MVRFGTVLKVTLVAAILGACSAGCSKKPSQEAVAKLDQATAAAEAAERKLSDLRTERQALEQQLEGKKQEPGKGAQ